MKTIESGSHNVYITLGASNHTDKERHRDDLYCTHPDATKKLLDVERFSVKIWEPCDGLGHISDVLIENGYNVRRSDLYTRGRDIEQLDFLSNGDEWNGDIITNPPYSCATKMVRKALSVVAEGYKVAMWLRILYLESAERKRLFEEFPPVRVWISSRRIPCGKEGKFGASAQGYAWFIWQKGHYGETILKWF